MDPIRARPRRLDDHRPADPEIRPDGRPFPSAEFAEAASEPPGSTLRGSWSYRDASGRETFRVLRFETFATKAYRTIRRDPGGSWALGAPEGPLPIYRLPEILAEPGAIVWVVEGEKVAELLALCGLLTTTGALGPRSASSADWSPLSGRRVVVVPDRDPPGFAYARDVAARLLVLDRPAEVRIVELAGISYGEDFEQYAQLLPRHWGPREVASHLMAIARATRAVGGRGGC